jgi:transcription elongation GreA/GreB family factor
MLPGAAVEAPTPVARTDVFQAVWRAHRTRAQHEQDWRTFAAASVLIDAAVRVPAGSLVAAKVTLGGTVHAVFADIDRKVILAIVQPAEVYLAGLSG